MMIDEEKVNENPEETKPAEVETTEVAEEPAQEVKKEEVKAEETASTPAEKPAKQSKKKPKEEKTEEKPEETLSDDELYAKIETEKMLKAKAKRKWITASLMGVVLVLAVVFICLSVIPTNLIPKFLLQNDYVAYVHISNSSTPKSGMLSKTSNTTEYNKLKELLNDAFTQSTIAAMFNGGLGNYEFDETANNDSVLTRDAFLTKYTSFVRFVFDDDSKIILTNKNGTPYKSTRSSRASFEFSEAFLILSDDETNQTADFFVVVDAQNSDTQYVIEFTGVGETAGIYDYFAD